MPHVSIKSAGVLMVFKWEVFGRLYFKLSFANHAITPNTLVGLLINEASRRSPRKLLLYVSDVVLLIHPPP